MRLEQLRKAYKIAENVSVDYDGMTPEEIKELDDALDTVFKLARTAIERDEEESEERDLISKIRVIVYRALLSSDPINLYKACCINEIAELLGVKPEELRNEEPVETDNGQVTIDDII